MGRRTTNLSFALVAVLLMTACAPGQTTTGQAPGTEARPQPEKILRVAIQSEPFTWNRTIVGGPSLVAGGANNVEFIAADGLRRTMSGGVTMNLLAAEVPDNTRGPWVVRPDSTMDMTWKIVPNAKWHDGAPVTSADFLFTVKIQNDPEASGLPGGGGAGANLIGVTAIDDYTFTAHWKSVNVTAINGDGLNLPLPRHLLEPTYERNKAGVRDLRYFTSEFIGTGPFKLVRHEPGTFMEFERFDDYYRGRPSSTRSS
ncbi:MAG: hypothetical protein HY534_02810 [Chloroflexi bacterium]|nr:hypothetical protein [Chloroflexota bacterium]